ncbi:hypothetical protein MMB17_18600 [Methylobacterium organophilum]|uniref:hypothetical protein n=1 Tax=Methylobacterium organophilum TaxID=410 RepID=UPI001F144B50|nr:hypothetical protein [Methylobacterium organophilum]UMY16673.1 hypothetical protein MMB17_18600 [Methylobacterium organophilum]
MADFPLYPFTTQEDWYGELSFQDTSGNALSLAGRSFVMPITQAVAGTTSVEPVLELSMQTGGGLSLKAGADNTLIFRVPRSTTRGFPRGVFTADVLEVVGDERHLFMPVRVNLYEPSGLLSYVSRFVGVVVNFAARQQPIITPVAIAGRQGERGATIIPGTIPPTSLVGKDGDYYIEDRTASNQGRRMWGPKAGGAWPSEPWAIQAPAIGHTTVQDADYQCLPSDVQVGIATLTAGRTISLPDVDSYPMGQTLFIADESGACSETRPITVQAGAGTGDSIAGQASLQITNPYQGLGFRRGAANLWILA